MSGTKAGSVKAIATIRKVYGLDFFSRIGRKGGQNSKLGGFTARPELASIAGRIGGKISKRGKAKPKEDQRQ